MTARRSLNLKLIFSVLAAFLLSMAFSWLLHDRLSERDAYAQYGGVALGWAFTSGRLAGIHAAEYVHDQK